MLKTKILLALIVRSMSQAAERRRVFVVGVGMTKFEKVSNAHLRTSDTGFNPGFTTFYITNAGGEPRDKPGVWRPEMWAQASI
jgi:hypothetical protein